MTPTSHIIKVPARRVFMPEGLHPTAPIGYRSPSEFLADRDPVSVGSFASYAHRFADQPFAVVSWGAAGIRLVSRLANEAAAQRVLDQTRGGGRSHTIERLIPDADRLQVLTTQSAPTDPLIGATLLEAWGYLTAAENKLPTPVQWLAMTSARLFSGGMEFLAAAELAPLCAPPLLLPRGCTAYPSEVGAMVYVNAWEWVLPLAREGAEIPRIHPHAAETTTAESPLSAIGHSALVTGAMRRAIPRHKPQTAIMFRGVREEEPLALDDRATLSRAAPSAAAEEEPRLRVASGGRRG
ncbi:MAG: hypothetical protein HY696_02605 [Deltaproteobacteria bacterium]|nr:hypothetical protein [Deltaproteobacteria bacterium]